MGTVRAFPSVGHSYAVVITVRLPTSLSSCTPEITPGEWKCAAQPLLSFIVALYAVAGARAHVVPCHPALFPQLFPSWAKCWAYCSNGDIKQFCAYGHICLSDQRAFFFPRDLLYTLALADHTIHHIMWVSRSRLTQRSARRKNTVAVHHSAPNLPPPHPQKKKVCACVCDQNISFHSPSSPPELWRLA